MQQLRDLTLMKHYDVVVIGLGIMGSATLWHLVKSGVRSLGIDAYGPTHPYGSSHGATRIFRRAYWEGEKYLPLLHRAHQQWTELHQTSTKSLITPTGGVFIGPHATGVVSGSQRTAQAGAIPHEIWDAAEIRRRLPAFQVADHMQAIYEPGAYTISAEDVRLHLLNEAIYGSATVWYGSTVEALQHIDGCVQIFTSSGSIVHANTVIITAGPWITKSLLPELRPYLTPNRVPIYWFKPRPEYLKSFDCGTFPAFLYECDDGSLLYGLHCNVGSEKGVKIGFHNRQHIACKPDKSTQSVSNTQKEEIVHYVEQIFTGLYSNPVDAQLCFYTMSTDESFIVGVSKHHPGVFYASVCSGHGFKFAPAIGEALSALAQGKVPPVDIFGFQADRFET
jgi:sarcosine oxidase